MVGWLDAFIVEAETRDAIARDIFCPQMTALPRSSFDMSTMIQQP